MDDTVYKAQNLESQLMMGWDYIEFSNDEIPTSW